MLTNRLLPESVEHFSGIELSSGVRVDIFLDRSSGYYEVHDSDVDSDLVVYGYYSEVQAVCTLLECVARHICKNLTSK